MLYFVDLHKLVVCSAVCYYIIFYKQISGLKASNIKWLSVWCRAYSVNFGDVMFERAAVEVDASSSGPIEKSTTPKSIDSKVEVERVGEIRTLQYMVASTVFIIDENTLKIEDFTYDGKGPDAFFYVGESGSPSGAGTMVPYPEGSGTDAVLTKADMLDITLRLPAGK